MKSILNGLNGAVIVASVVLAGLFGGAAVASASTDPVISVQDGDSGGDGADNRKLGRTSEPRRRTRIAGRLGGGSGWRTVLDARGGGDSRHGDALW